MPREITLQDDDAASVFRADGSEMVSLPARDSETPDTIVSEAAIKVLICIIALHDDQSAAE